MTNRTAVIELLQGTHEPLRVVADILARAGIRDALVEPSFAANAPPTFARFVRVSIPASAPDSVTDALTALHSAPEVHSAVLEPDSVP